MVNQSKANDSRFWAIWGSSGAVGDKYETERRKAIHHYRHVQEDIGNLTRLEIKELEQFEFPKGHSTIEDQVRRYHLKLKSDRPDIAEQMLTDTSQILQKGIHNISDVEVLCRTLYKYWSNFLIKYEGTSYTVSNNTFQKI